MGKLGIEVLLKIFDVAYDLKRTGKEAKKYKKFFETVAEKTPEPKNQLDVLDEIFPKRQKDVIERKKLITRLNKRMREINKTFIHAFGPSVVEIKCQRGISWRLDIQKDFLDGLQGKNIPKVNEFLRNRYVNKGKKEEIVRKFDQQGTRRGDQLIIKTRPQLSVNFGAEESIAGLKGSDYELDKLLDIAKESVLIVGQNLHFLVKDEIEAAENGHEIIGRFRKSLSIWLKKYTKGKVEIVILDLRAKDVVLKRAVKSKSKQKFIDDLCNATARYRVWQDEIDSKHFEVRVSNILPPSLVVIDAKNTDTGLMTLTQYSYGYETGERPTHIVQKKFKPKVFKRIYNVCRQDIGPEHTKKITDIKPTDIKNCRKLKDKLV